VVFVENNAQTSRRLQEMLNTLDCETGVILRANALKTDLSAHGPLNLVFLDPPFGSLELGNLCKLLETSGCLADSAHIYVEMSRDDILPELPSNWHSQREQTAGQVRFALLERRANSQGSAVTGE
jgi:16S rRNA (guanine966-N2)-methyltransferase